ncbi:MAG: leucyl aminopeptidase family protein [Chitinispirillaceae bacterium]|nr:leucyl aminopeptidase family protein [Chitinispirillaceae bacterium]
MIQIRKVKHSDYLTIIRFLCKDTTKDIVDFKAEVEEITVRYEQKKTIIYCGLGEADKCSVIDIRAVVMKAISQLKKLERKSVAIEIPSLPIDSKEVEKAIIDGIIIGSYEFSRYKSNNNSTELSAVELIGAQLSDSIIRKEVEICKGVNYARDLVNDNAGVVTPQYLAKEAKKLEKDGIKVTILNNLKLKKNGLNLITAVGQGSPNSPVLIILEYYGNKKEKKITALAGKGVTFDSGGQNLKGTGNIETMRHDMAGAAVVLGVFLTIAKLKPSINVIGIIPAVHNAIGSKSFFPGDVYRAYNGKTVEVISTDAEGRLILADAISYCIDKYNPTIIIDIATLTGGIITALGEFVAGLFSNNDDLAEKLFIAGQKTGERLWRLPIYKEYVDSMKSDIADLRNISKFKKGYASSITGAAFIKEFVGDIPWAHLDIAGTAYRENGPARDMPQFATGFGIRLISCFLEV